MKFQVVSEHELKGDLPHGIENWLQGIEAGRCYQTLLVVTGSEKTFRYQCHIAPQSL
jgi:excinuclease UvrABC helicase subunit UvrB